jgi:hypothetical protein
MTYRPRVVAIALAFGLVGHGCVTNRPADPQAEYSQILLAAFRGLLAPPKPGLSARPTCLSVDSVGTKVDPPGIVIDSLRQAIDSVFPRSACGSDLDQDRVHDTTTVTVTFAGAPPEQNFALLYTDWVGPSMGRMGTCDLRLGRRGWELKACRVEGIN